MSDLTIEATVITQSGTDLTPVAVKINGTGSIPNGALRAIAMEALATFTGSHESHHGFKVEAEPSFKEEMDDTISIFPVFRSLVRSEVPC